MYFLDKKINSTCIPKVFYVSDKKHENSLSIKGKCFKYNVQCSNILGKKHNISYISIWKLYISIFPFLKSQCTHVLCKSRNSTVCFHFTCNFVDPVCVCGVLCDGSGLEAPHRGHWRQLDQDPQQTLDWKS